MDDVETASFLLGPDKLVVKNGGDRKSWRRHRREKSLGKLERVYTKGVRVYSKNLRASFGRKEERQSLPKTNVEKSRPL
jgi:hypothetical protein